jgi:hypothetical protein
MKVIIAINNCSYTRHYIGKINYYPACVFDVRESKLHVYDMKNRKPLPDIQLLEYVIS